MDILTQNRLEHNTYVKELLYDRYISDGMSPDEAFVAAQENDWNPWDDMTIDFTEDLTS